MKLKGQTRAAYSVQKEQSGRRSPYLALRPSGILSKNLEGVQRQKLGRTLSPYLGELERRKKIRSVANPRSSKEVEVKKICKEASSKRFRIQELSYYPAKASSEYFKTITHKSERNSNKSIRQLETSSISKYQQDISAYTEKPVRIETISPSRPPFYSELYEKLKVKQRKDNKFRKGKFVESSLDGKVEVSESATTNNVLHLGTNCDNSGFTTNNIHPQYASGGTTISNEKAERKNFRRNKFDIQSQTIKEAAAPSNLHELKYNSTEIQKKESNSSLMREMDCQIEKEIEIQERHTKIKMKRMVEKSLERSTEEYFRDSHDYRKVRSKNEIESYISTVRNPSKVRNSQTSTINTSDAAKYSHVVSISSGKGKSLAYNFDIEEDVMNRRVDDVVIEESQNNTENNEDSVEIGESSDFQKQRREAERARFDQGGAVGVSWSEEQLEYNNFKSEPN